ETGVLEVTEPLGHRERQIENRGFATDGEPQLRNFRLVLRRRGLDQQRKRDRHAAGQARTGPPFHSQSPFLGRPADATTTSPAPGAPCSGGAVAGRRRGGASPAPAKAARTCAPP